MSLYLESRGGVFVGNGRLFAPSAVDPEPIYSKADFAGYSFPTDRITIVCVTFELTPRERRSVMRRICWARSFIVLLFACLIFGWMMGGPILPRVIGTVINLLWTAGMVMYIRRLQQQLSMSVGRP